MAVGVGNEGTRAVWCIEIVNNLSTKHLRGHLVLLLWLWWFLCVLEVTAVTRLYVEASLQKVYRLYPWISEQQRNLEWGGWWRSPWELQKEAKLPKSRAGRSEPSLSSEQIMCGLLWNKTSNMCNKSGLNYMIRPLNVKQDAHQVRAYKNLTNLSWLIFLLLANCFAV